MTTIKSPATVLLTLVTPKLTPAIVTKLTRRQLTNTEDVNAKMRASGWDVIDILDGNWDVVQIVDSLETARRSKNKPTFVNVRTIIGLDSKVAGDAVAHGAALGKDNVACMKELYGFHTEENFAIGPETREFFANLPERGEVWVREWTELVGQYTAAHPELAASFHKRMAGELDPKWKEIVPKTFPEKPTATRAASGLVLNPIAKDIDSFIVGTADLSPSVYMSWEGMTDFQHVRGSLLPRQPCQKSLLTNF